MNNRRTLNEDGSAWVLFRPSGYPFKLKKQLNEAITDEQLINLIRPYILGIHLPTLDGGVVTIFPEQKQQKFMSFSAGVPAVITNS